MPRQYLELERQVKCHSEIVDGEVFVMSGGSRALSRLSANLIYNEEY